MTLIFIVTILVIMALRLQPSNVVENQKKKAPTTADAPSKVGHGCSTAEPDESKIINVNKIFIKEFNQ